MHEEAVIVIPFPQACIDSSAQIVCGFYGRLYSELWHLSHGVSAAVALIKDRDSPMNSRLARNIEAESQITSYMRAPLHLKPLVLRTPKSNLNLS